ncbi:MAG: hypothetical protein ABI640_21950 [Gammaproteobacteria bacterium]
MTDIAKLDRFLTVLAEQGHMKRSATAAGLTLEEVARWAREDDAFNERLKDARAARRYHVADALFEEGVLGREVVDSVNGKITHVRNVSVLTALAKQLDELPADKPTAAVQINNANNAAANDPRLVAAVKANGDRLRALLAKPALPIITVEATPVDPDHDILE